MLKEAIKDIPDSMGESNLESKAVTELARQKAVPDLARLIKEHFRKPDLNSTPAAPNIRQNHSNSQEEEQWWDHVFGTAGEFECPYTRHLSNTVPGNGQPTVGREFQPAQTGLLPQVHHPYTSQVVPTVSTEAFSSWWDLPQQPYHQSSQNPQYDPYLRTSQQPNPQRYMKSQDFGNPQTDTTSALFQGYQSMQNRHISRNAQIDQGVPIARIPQRAQESQVRGQISQSYQFNRGNGPEFVNGPQQLDGSRPNRYLQQGHGFQQGIEIVQRSLGQRSQAYQEGQDQNQGNGPQQGKGPQSRTEHA